MSSSPTTTSSGHHSKRRMTSTPTKDLLTLYHGRAAPRRPKNVGKLFLAVDELWGYLSASARKDYFDSYQLMLIVAIASHLHCTNGDLTEGCLSELDVPSLCDIPLVVQFMRKCSLLQWIQAALSFLFAPSNLLLPSDVSQDKLALVVLLQDHLYHGAFGNVLRIFLEHDTADHDRRSEVSYLYQSFYTAVKVMAEDGDFGLSPPTPTQPLVHDIPANSSPAHRGVPLARQEIMIAAVEKRMREIAASQDELAPAERIATAKRCKAALEAMIASFDKTLQEEEHPQESDVVNEEEESDE